MIDKKQCVILEDRKYLKVTNVEGVISLTDTEANIIVGEFILNVKGNSLKAETLSVDTGDLILTGNIDSLKYEDKKQKQGIFKRIFK